MSIRVRLNKGIEYASPATLLLSMAGIEYNKNNIEGYEAYEDIGYKTITIHYKNGDIVEQFKFIAYYYDIDVTEYLLIAYPARIKELLEDSDKKIIKEIKQVIEDVEFEINLNDSLGYSTFRDLAINVTNITRRLWDDTVNSVYDRNNGEILDD